MAIVLVPTSAAQSVGDASSRQIASGGVTAFSAAPFGADGLQSPELALTEDVDSGDDDIDSPVVVPINRTDNHGLGERGPEVDGGRVGDDRARLATGFNGLNHRDQRLANGGNQFSVEPPDQGLCVGNGFVLESANDVLRVFNTAGTPLMGVVDLNSFYGYPAAINRTTGARGPAVTDPSCLFDTATQRWFNVVLTLDSDVRTGRNTGRNHLDVAVSQTSSPLGAWTIYRIPVQDDGTEGTPNHNCAPGPGSIRPTTTNPRACLGDYPHIGADDNGFFITTNEFSFFGGPFRAAQLYAFDKRALAAGASAVTVSQLDTLGVLGGRSGHTVWPATSPAGAEIDDDVSGTEFFLSSAIARSAGFSGTSSTQIVVWALSNTASLHSATPALHLSTSFVDVGAYALPPKANQKVGSIPLAQCINDTSLKTRFGPGCWQLLFTTDPGIHNEVESVLDSNDARMQQVVFANGKLFGAVDTAVTMGGVNKAGIEFFVVKPSVRAGGVVGRLLNEGYVAVANNNVTYPAIGVLSNGHGAMGFTLTGADHFPSAAYVTLDAEHGAGPIQVAAEGVGPDDGFTSYRSEVGTPPRTRWGDYGAAVADGGSIWLASEYIAQTCTFAQYVADQSDASFGSCGGTRTSLGNWATRISRVQIDD